MKKQEAMEWTLNNFAWKDGIDLKEKIPKCEEVEDALVCDLMVNFYGVTKGIDEREVVEPIEKLIWGDDEYWEYLGRLCQWMAAIWEEGVGKLDSSNPYHVNRINCR